MFGEMQRQVNQLESELVHSKTKREKEAREFVRERREERQRVEAERETLKHQHEEQLAQLVAEHQLETEKLLKDAEEKRVRFYDYHAIIIYMQQLMYISEEAVSTAVRSV